MNIVLKKITLASMTGLMACSAFTFNGLDAKAAEKDPIIESLPADQTDQEKAFSDHVDQVLSSYDNLTPEQKDLYDKTMQEEITKHQGEAGFNEEQFKKEVGSFVFADQGKLLKNEISSQGRYRWTYTGIWLRNGAVAAGINLAITLATGGAATAGIKMLVKK